MKRTIFISYLNFYSINKYYLQDKFLLLSEISKKKSLNIRLDKYVRAFIKSKKSTIIRFLFLLLS